MSLLSDVQRNNRLVAVYIALVCFVMLLPLKVSADDIKMRGCRQGQMPEHIAARHTVRRAARRADNVNPYIGKRRQLVVLVSFTDLQFQSDVPLSAWNRLFNEENYTEKPFCGSIHDYFLAQSYGKFNLTFDLYEIALDESIVKYRSTYSDDANSQYLVEDIVDSLRTKPIDWSVYDWDDDLNVEQLVIVFPGEGMNTGGGSNSIWPHQWWMSGHKGSDGQYKLPLVVSTGDKEYLIDCYCCVPEKYKQVFGSFGTICHEFSHCFGFPDFYYGSTSYLEYWDLMDSGCWQMDGFCPTGYSAHERMLMGWLEPVELTEPCTVEGIEALSNAPQAYIIFNDEYGDEFYMVENRQQTGWDSGLPGSGIIVFHIDFDEEIWNYGVPNKPAGQRCSIFHANNKSSVLYQSDWAYPYEGNDSLTNFSAPPAELFHPLADESLYMSKPITRMKVVDGLASFDFMGGDATGIEEIKASSDLPMEDNVIQMVVSPLGDLKGALMDLPCGVYIIRYRNGVTRKVYW